MTLQQTFNNATGQNQALVQDGEYTAESVNGPREALTKDTKLKLSQIKREAVTDKTYKIGEISQKTGLQKQPDGSWAPPKGGAKPAAKKDTAPDFKIGSDVKVKVNGGRPGKITEIRGDVVTVEMPAQGELPARRDQYYKSDLEAAGAKEPSKRESVSAGRMQKDLDGNFWSRPDDFKEDITSRGWDVEEMNNEYAVISNDKGSQWEVRFDDHSDDGDLTVRTFKPLMIDEDDDEDD